MAASSSRPKTRSSGPVLRSLSPCGRFYSPPSNSLFSTTASAFASSTGSSFSSPSSTFFSHGDHDHHYHHHRSTSPTRVNLYTSHSISSSVRFSIDHRSISPNRSISASKQKGPISMSKKSCMCSPTSHPGSFRCSLHKNTSNVGNHHHGTSYPSTRLNMRRSAMKNSLVRIGGVEGEWVKRALTALIHPSSHHQRRRSDFQLNCIRSRRVFAFSLSCWIECAAQLASQPSSAWTIPVGGRVDKGEILYLQTSKAYLYLGH